MPKTTNELEAQFKHLGERWERHSGLKERNGNTLCVGLYTFTTKKNYLRRKSKRIKFTTRLFN